MPLTKFAELAGTQRRRANPPGMFKTFVLEGEEDGFIVESLAINSIDPIIQTASGLLYLENVETEHVGHKLWYAHSEYGQRQAELGSFQVKATTTGGTMKIYAALALINKYPSSLPNTLMIGVKPDGPPEGTEIVIPTLQVDVAIRMPGGVITAAFAKNIARLTGTVNAAPWCGAWDAGEALYLGADMSYGSDSPVEVVHHVALQENLVGASFFGQTIDKQGWDIAWPYYSPDPSANKYIQRVDGVYVQRIYRRYNFAAFLGFG